MATPMSVVDKARWLLYRIDIPRGHRHAAVYFLSISVVLTAGVSNLIAATTDARRLLAGQAGVNAWGIADIRTWMFVTFVPILLTTVSFWRGARWWGVITDVLAVIPILVLLIATTEVGAIPHDYIPWGGVSSELVHAGFLFVAAIGICIVAFMVHGQLIGERSWGRYEVERRGSMSMLNAAGTQDVSHLLTSNRSFTWRLRRKLVALRERFR